MISCEFGKELRRLREFKGFSLNEVSGFINVSANYLSQVERGLRYPPSEIKIKKLEHLFKVNTLTKLAIKDCVYKPKEVLRRMKKSSEFYRLVIGLMGFDEEKISIINKELFDKN